MSGAVPARSLFQETTISSPVSDLRTRILLAAEELFAGGERNAQVLRDTMTEMITREPLADIDYVSIADQDSLEELDITGDRAVALLAVRIGATRLIDNRLLPEETEA